MGIFCTWLAAATCCLLCGTLAVESLQDDRRESQSNLSRYPSKVTIIHRSPASHPRIVKESSLKRQLKLEKDTIAYNKEKLKEADLFEESFLR